MEQRDSASVFSGLIDLASAKAGGKAVYASDEFFAPKENLLKEGRGIFIPDKFTENGKWMDGWESRRKRAPGFDWCVIRLGVSGKVRGIDIDTNHFLGNHPPYASAEGLLSNEELSIEDIVSGNLKWKEILIKSPLNPGSQNLFAVNCEEILTYIKLNIYPDGGVARFRVFGEPFPEWKINGKKVLTDLAGLLNGGRVIVCNDMFFGSKDNLISPGRSNNMGDGWETKRKRIPGYDWTIIKLGASGKIKKITVDTNYFKGNYPDRCSLDGLNNPGLPDYKVTDKNLEWKLILPETKLKGDYENEFENIPADESFSHVRLNIFPDGGVSRLRIYGIPD